MAIKPTTIRERLLYEYAKLISRSATDRSDQDRYWRFTAVTYRRLLSGDVSPSSLTRDNKKLVRGENACAYCGARDLLQWEHIIPKSRGGPDTIDNQVLACRRCNSSKGAKDVLAWWPADRATLPPLVYSKYLKLLLAEHEAAGTLDHPGYPLGAKLTLGRLHMVFGRPKQAPNEL